MTLHKRWLPRGVYGVSLPKLSASDMTSVSVLARRLCREASRGLDKAELIFKVSGSSAQTHAVKALLR